MEAPEATGSKQVDLFGSIRLLLGFGLELLRRSLGLRFRGLGFKACGLRCKVYGSGLCSGFKTFRARSFGSMVRGLGLWVLGSEFRIEGYGSGFRVRGFGFRV